MSFRTGTPLLPLLWLLPPQPVQPPVTETKAETSAKKGFPAWVIAVIIAVAVLLIGGGILIGVLASGDKSSVDADSDSADSYYDEDADEYIENELGLKIAYAKKEITVQNATDEDYKYLDMKDFDMVAVVKSYTYLDDTSLFQYTESRHRPDKFRFVDFARRHR